MKMPSREGARVQQPRSSAARQLRALHRQVRGWCVLPGRSATDALTWFGNRTTLAPAAEAVGGVSSIHSGQRASVTVNFTPGVYLLFYAADEADPHPVFVQRTVTIPTTPGSPLATTRQRATR
jgi:hypothetical protein